MPLSPAARPGRRPRKSQAKPQTENFFDFRKCCKAAKPVMRPDRFAVYAPELASTFKGRHFQAAIIVLCVRWYLRFGLGFRNLKEIMAKQNLFVDHVTIWRLCKIGVSVASWLRIARYKPRQQILICADEVVPSFERLYRQ